MKARELLKTLAQIKRREVPKATIEPQVAELTAAISKDPVVTALLSEQGIPLDTFALDLRPDFPPTFGRIRRWFCVLVRPCFPVSISLQIPAA